MRLELTRVGLLVELANHYTTKGALFVNPIYLIYMSKEDLALNNLQGVDMP